MKKAMLFIVLALFMINISCGSSGSSHSSSSGTTAVTIRLGQAGASSATMAGAVDSAAAVPSGVTAIRVTVSADDIETIVKEVPVAGEGSVTIVLDIPNGPDRHILVEALDASGNVLYSGETVVDLEGEPLQLTIVMSPSCNLFVDSAGSDNSDCTDVNNPCGTITYALSQTGGNVTVCVEGGRYDISSETFPITLKTGVRIRCLGAGHTTIIDSTVPEGSSPDTIIGAAGASIEGCSVNTGFDSTAISDNGSTVTINDCLINGAGGANAGISITADSTVSNSSIINFQGVEGGGAGIFTSGANPTISGNTFNNNTYAIYIESGSPAISGNTIGNSIGEENDTGIYVVAGAASVTGNTITYNSEGVFISGGNPVINNNTLSCNSGVDLNNLIEGAPEINARNNRWDTVEGLFINTDCSGIGEDICAPNGGSVDFAGALQAPACIDIGPAGKGM